jgi:SAM-dependent methyltransferase
MDDNRWDRVAEAYDGHYDTPECRAEDRAVLELIGDVNGKRVLDIGCGTGWLLDHVEIPPESYTGVDPSGPMLAQLIQKHPGHKRRVFQKTFKQAVVSPLFGQMMQADLVVALFGAGAFLDSSDIRCITRHLLKPQGWFILMTYSKPQPMVADWGFEEEYPNRPTQLQSRQPSLAIGFHEAHVFGYSHEGL